MSEHQNSEDPEPSHPAPAGTLFVPVRPGPAGFSVRLFRTALGARTAVAFTTANGLAATLGPQQSWIRLSEHAVRDLTEPLGVTALTVDPQLAAPATAPATAPVTVPVTVPGPLPVLPLPAQSAGPYGTRRPSAAALPPFQPGHRTAPSARPAARRA
ncbi:SAV_915 family protein [Streptomyces liangshanensis]|uniref:SAV_915 family protein n=1 Tax=Streptomyces liangshanensis TaxID=2717324 RepID=UPI001AB0115A|nr:SAV_915 family protein [Streptomyces liangshanensis]